MQSVIPQIKFLNIKVLPAVPLAHRPFTYLSPSTQSQIATLSQLTPSLNDYSLRNRGSTTRATARSAESIPPPHRYDLVSAKVLVETSMLAAVSGVCQLVLAILKLESYLYYLLPFPLVLAALRSGPKASRKTLVATFFLCLVLLGIPRAVSYVLLYGLVGLTLGTTWHLRTPWWVTWICCTLSYVAGLFAYINVASLLLREDLFKLVTYNVCTTITKVSSMCGIQGRICLLESDVNVIEVNPSSTVVLFSLIFFLALRGFMYTYVLQFGYSLLLKGMGYQPGPMPKIIDGMINSDNRIAN